MPPPPSDVCGELRRSMGHSYFEALRVSLLGGLTMRTRLAIGLTATLGLTTLFACSSSTQPYQDPSEYCTAYAKAICSVSDVCGFDAGTCQSYQDTQCNTAASAAVASGTRAYKPGNVPACITAVQNAYGNANTTVTEA